MTEWRDIEGHAGYAVSRCGMVRGPSGKVLRPFTAAPRGYPDLVYFKVALWSGGSRRVAYVHRLVCRAFNGDAPPGYGDCSHLDHNTANNAADNLAWSTHVDNCRERHSPDAAELRAIRAEQRGEFVGHDVVVAGVPF